MNTNTANVIPGDAFCPRCEFNFGKKELLFEHIKHGCKIELPSDASSSKGPQGCKRELPTGTSDASAAKRPCRENITRCVTCDLNIPSAGFSGHLRSIRHKASLWLPSAEGVEVCRSAFGGRISSYKVMNVTDTLDIGQFFQQAQAKCLDILSNQLAKLSLLKTNFELFGLYYLPSKDIREVKSFMTPNKVVCQSTDLSGLYVEFSQLLETKASEFLERESGWLLEKLLYLEVAVSKSNPLRGTSYIPLPKSIVSKRAIVNIKNDDQFCFAWALTAWAAPAATNPNRTTSYPHFSTVFDYSEIEFPVALKSIPNFETKNNISINVYGLDKIYIDGRCKYQIVGPLHLSARKRSNHVNLLLLDDQEGNYHYCYIKNLSRLISSQLSSHKSALHFCDGCLQTFSSEEKLTEHSKNDCDHVRVILPQLGSNILKFQDYQKQLKVPFVVYADFECILKRVESVETGDESFTVRKYEHIPTSFSYYIKCDYEDSLSSLELYTGLDAPDVFISRLERDVKKIYENHLNRIVPMKALTTKEEAEFKNATVCHICEKTFNIADPKVRDHCHLTGQFRAAAHTSCNLQYKFGNFVPVFFHNLKNYDCHLFIRNLAKSRERIDIIPYNFEKYLSFTKHIYVGEKLDSKGKLKKLYCCLRFLDSFQFLSSSLDTLAGNLKSDQCREVRKFYLDDLHFNLARQKGIFCYSYLDDFSKLSKPKLPCKNRFYNELLDEHISDEEYLRAKQVWDVFKCKSLKDYYEIYLKSDVLLLADVFENFRDLSLKTYKLDPAHFYSLPGLSWLSMLRYTKVELELLTDIDMISLFKNLKGGITSCITRKALANNKFCPNYDPEKPTSFIIYLDMTSMYAATMQIFKLPTHNFAWLSKTEIGALEKTIPLLSDSSDTGYVFEVDLEYPESLHDSHCDLPFCVEKMSPPGSKYCKLIPNLNHKEKYVIHYIALKQCLANGLVLKKIHRGVKFSQSAWLKPYIDLNADLRAATDSPFESSFYKLSSNCIYGKSVERVENRCNIKLATQYSKNVKKNGAENYISRPNFEEMRIFDEDLVAIRLGKLFMYLNKPIYIGFCILDLSKTLIYDFFYDHLKKLYGDKLTLLYTDTDSLIISVETPNFYQDMKENLEKFDTSNFPEDNIHGIPKSISKSGLMKSEFGPRIIEAFYGTGAKAYALKVDEQEYKRAKGVKKSAINKQLTLNHYRSVVENKTNIYCTMYTFRSYSHKIFTNYMKKVALSHFDDKRFQIPDSTKTLPWGHKDITEIQAEKKWRERIDEFVNLMRQAERGEKI